MMIPTTAIHYAVPVFVDDEPVKPYTCQRCGEGIELQSEGMIGWKHTTKTTEGKAS